MCWPRFVCCVILIIQLATVFILHSTVHAIYSKTGGKNGKHAAVTDKSNVASISYMVVQLFEPALQSSMATLTFRDRPERLALLNVKEYALITSPQFLLLLSHAPVVSSTGLTLSSDDSAAFMDLNKLSKNLKKVMEIFRRKKTNYS
ncbi:hypothetical protein JOM56_003034 [Amanita muscaria]